MLDAVLRAPVAFFDATPSGRLLNRFSSDLSSIDDEVMDELFLMVDAACALAAVVAVVVCLAPWLTLAWAPVLAVTYGIARRYLATSRELKRLDSTTRSPLYTAFSELLEGLSTIRAFGRGRLFAAKNDRALDAHTAAELALWVSNRWLVFRLQVVSACVFFSVGLYAVLAARGTLPAVGSPTAVGLVLLYATQRVAGPENGGARTSYLRGERFAIRRLEASARTSRTETEMIPRPRR